MRHLFFYILFISLCACTNTSNKKVGEQPAADSLAINYRPVRAPYEGFQWMQVKGCGLSFWAQYNGQIRIMVDPAIPGVVMVREGDAVPHRVMQLFSLKNRSINDVINSLRQQPGWDETQTCAFKEIKSPRSGVHRYVLIPSGDYARKVEQVMKQEPVPSTCNGWGTGNSGMRYFEVHDSHPDKAIFVEIGQDAPLFDENSISFTDDTCATDVLTMQEGILTIGHEVRSFRPDGSDEEFWVVDKTGRLMDMYDKATGGMKNGKPTKVRLKLEYNGKWEDGFAAEYAGVYFVREVLALEKAD